MQDQRLDEMDRRILAELQREGRQSHVELSERVNLSPSACLRRVKRLEQVGIIAGYVALLDRAQAGRSTTVFVEITLDGQADEVLDAFEAAVLQVPDVLECHLMAGSADYLIKVVAKDSEHFAEVHRKQIATLPGVARIQSSFSLRRVLESTVLPV
ncbi:MAG: AsnC family transcriptional regulator [Gammaproteobacteria bacterium]|nr:MAG: AsnC family transcriptional regulator [Gammaproteobacteria bacterium]